MSIKSGVDDEGALEEGDDCFAHVKGYPWWPAQVTRIGGNKRIWVIFYGTNEVAQLPMKELKPVTEETLEKFVTGAALKRKYFKSGLDEMRMQEAKRKLINPRKVEILRDVSNRKCSSRTDPILLKQNHMAERTKYSATLSAALEGRVVDDLEITIEIETVSDFDAADSLLDVIGYKPPAFKVISDRVETAFGDTEDEKEEEDTEDEEKEEPTKNRSPQSKDKSLPCNANIRSGKDKSLPIKNKSQPSKTKSNSPGNVRGRKAPVKSVGRKSTKKVVRSLRDDEMEGDRLFSLLVEVKDDCYFCKKCSFSTITKLLARSHVRTCGSGKSCKKGRPKKLSTCLECGEVFSSMKELKTHHRKKHLSSLYSCTTCLKQFSHRPAFVKHVRSHKEPRMLTCPHQDCTKKFRYNYHLKRHLATHSNRMQMLKRVSYHMFSHL